MCKRAMNAKGLVEIQKLTKAKAEVCAAIEAQSCKSNEAQSCKSNK